MDRPNAVPALVQPLPRWARESLGAAGAVAIAVAVVGAVAASRRSDLVFRDGDSLVTTLVVRSLAAGQPQDWAMSSVLFLPETALLGLLSLLGLGVNGTLALAGVLNVVALYGAFRVAAGAAGVARAPIAGALAGLGGFALVAMTESSPSRDSLELASLLVTTTYYSATVVATVLAVGIARRALPAPGCSVTLAEAAPPKALTLLLGAVAAASVLTNPLFAVWTTVPLGIVLAVVAVMSRSRAALWLVVSLVAGSVAGFVGRMPLSHAIANTGAGYADVTRWSESAAYYGELLAERWTTPWGALGILLVDGLWVWAVVATGLLARRGDVAAAMVAACGWVMPLLVTVGAIALGTNAARYLQPVEFAPLLGLVVLPGVLRPRALSRSRSRAERQRRSVRGTVAIAAGTAVVLVATASLGAPRIAAAASAPDPDLDCVVNWVDDSGRVGAGQFWTVRLAKTHVADPRALVQVDHRLRGYAWLVNRDDFAVGEVSFLLIDDRSPAFDLPDGATLSDAELTRCGRYTIADFGERVLRLGPERS